MDDIRESPSLELLEILGEKGAVLAYHDPYVARMKVTRKHGDLLGMESIELTAEALAEHDAVLISTDHSCIDYAFVVRHAQMVVDTRNATARVTEGRDKIVPA